jgi:hypothetical protein
MGISAMGHSLKHMLLFSTRFYSLLANFMDILLPLHTDIQGFERGKDVALLVHVAIL